MHVLTIILAGLLCLTAGQMSGSLDVSFSTDGIVEVVVNHTLFAAVTPYQTLTTSDGKIVAALVNEKGLSARRDIGVARFTGAGVLDPTFANGGIMLLPSLTRYPSSNPFIALDTANRIYVVARTKAGADRYIPAIARLSTSGALDGTFGGSSGIVPIFFPDSSTKPQMGWSVFLDSLGRVVVSCALEVGAVERTGIARFNSNGVLDATFAGTGMMILGGTTGPPFDAALGPSDSIYAGVLIGSRRMSIQKVLPSGSLDLTFGLSGTTPDLSFGTNRGAGYPNRIIVQPDGKPLICGNFDETGNRDSVFLRFTTAGQGDTSFAGDGSFVAIVDSADESMTSCDLTATGQIIATVLGKSTGAMTLVRILSSGGYDTNFDGDGRRPLAKSTFGFPQSILSTGAGYLIGTIWGSANFSLVRFLPATYSVDMSFGMFGYAAATGIPPRTQTSTIVADQRADPSRIYIAGTVDRPGEFGSVTSVAVSALNIVDGSVDTTFGSGGRGYFVTSYGSSTDEIAPGSVLPLPDGKLINVFGWTQPGGGSVAAVVSRHNVDGSIDTSFGSSGSRLASPAVGESIRDPVAALVPGTGAILVAARSTSGSEIWLNRITSSGSQDAAFNGGSGLKSSTGDSTWGSLNSVEDIVFNATFGESYIVGNVANGLPTRGAVWKFSSAGVAASLYGASPLSIGRVRVDPGSGFTSSKLFSGLTIPTQPNLLYVGGFASNTSGQYFFMARLLGATGALDSSFARQGRLFVGESGGFSYIRTLRWDASLGRIIAFGLTAQSASSQRVAIFRLNPSNAQLDCFGQSGNVLRRDLVEEGVVGAIVSDYPSHTYVIATANTVFYKALRYKATGMDSCESLCGNGLLEPFEQCDDGNIINGDGCSFACNVEVGYACPNPGGPCVAFWLSPSLPPLATSTPVATPARAPISAPMTAPAPIPALAPISAPLTAAAPVTGPASAPAPAPVRAPALGPVSSPTSVAPVPVQMPDSVPSATAPTAVLTPPTTSAPSIVPSTPVADSFIPSFVPVPAEASDIDTSRTSAGAIAAAVIAVIVIVAAIVTIFFLWKNGVLQKLRT